MTTQNNNFPMMSDYQLMQHEQYEADMRAEMDERDILDDIDEAWELRQHQIEVEKELAWDMLHNMRFEPFEEQAFWDDQLGLVS